MKEKMTESLYPLHARISFLVDIAPPCDVIDTDIYLDSEREDLFRFHRAVTQADRSDERVPQISTETRRTNDYNR